jgi:head-tail adaptor
MLTTAELEAMRAVQESALPDVCTVTRLSATADNYGGVTEDWDEVVDDVPCRVGVPTRAELAILSERVSESAGWTVTVPVGTDVAGDDRITVGSRRFQVAANPLTSWATALRCVCWEVK